MNLVEFIRLAEQNKIQIQVKKLLLSIGGPVVKNLPTYKWDYVIAVDSGGNYLFQNNLQANLLIGDLDSISKDALKFFKQNNTIIEKYDPDKDFTDFELALMKIKEYLPAIVYINGFWGGRIDHSISNLLTLVKYCNNALFLFDTDDGCGGVCSRSYSRIYLPTGTKVALIALSDVISLSSTGVRWKLENAKLEYGEARGISNYTISNCWNISFESGCLCFIVRELSCEDIRIEWFPLSFCNGEG